MHALSLSLSLSPSLPPSPSLSLPPSPSLSPSPPLSLPLPPSLSLTSNESSPEPEDAVLKTVIARFAYTPQYDDELGFGAGDLIEVTVDSKSFSLCKDQTLPLKASHFVQKSQQNCNIYRACSVSFITTADKKTTKLLSYVTAYIPDWS